jgi:hypothetical protein
MIKYDLSVKRKYRAYTEVGVEENRIRSEAFKLDPITNFLEVT